ncbi:MAG: hypothetical protein IPL61_26425 [Myxococcales bacterium]|nr:hypothetical protein [Myxococcales bacterium]
MRGRAMVMAVALVASTGASAVADDDGGVSAAGREAARLAHEAARLAETARDVRDLLYYLSDPRGFQYDYYRAADQVQHDPVLGPLVRNLAALYQHRTWEWKAQAQALADTATPASAAVGVGLTWDAPLCRLFEAQGSAQGFYEDRAAHAALAWGVGGCLPLPFDTFELGYRGRRQVRRSLLALPIATSGERASGDTVYANLRFYRWLSAGHQVDVAPMSFQFDWARTTATTFQSWASIAPVHWARRGKGHGGRDQTYDFMRIEFTTLGLLDDGVVDPLVAAISPLAIDGVRLGDQVAVGLDVGFEIGEFTSTATTAVQRRALHLDASVVASAGPATIEVHARNAMQPTVANQILDEDRLTARIDLDRPAAWVRADAFASHARLLSLDRYSQKVWTYGAGADLTMALTDLVYLYARVEGARNIVVDATAAQPATADELRGTVGVTAELRRRL